MVNIEELKFDEKGLIPAVVVDDESKQYIVRFSHDMKWISWGKMNTCESNCVKYWMPLPKAPKDAK